MAKTKKPSNGEAPPPRRMPNTESPFRRILFSERDIGGIGGGGGPPKEFVLVDKAYREALADTLIEAGRSLYEDLEKFPGQLGPLVFKLRPDGIAKSHRPLKLLEESGLMPAGHERIEEMLVAAHAGSFSALHSLILQRDIQAIRANLSVIQRIEPWSRQRRNPEGATSLRHRGRALMRLFQYGNDAANVALIDSMTFFLKNLGIAFKFHERKSSRSILTLLNLDNLNDETMDRLLSHPGVRKISPEPIYSSSVPAGLSVNLQSGLSNFKPPLGAPTVAIFDTGVSANAVSLQPWITGRDTYVIAPDTDYEHGTNVASLVASAHYLNQNYEDLPVVGCFVYDVCGLEAGLGGYVSDLMTRLKSALKKRPDIKIWNLSLGSASPCDQQIFSEFAQTLDELSDTYDVLFVVAAGNYIVDPRRTWPPAGVFDDRISSPGESVRALTVGSICHSDASDSLSKVGDPAPYSRCGPGPVFTPKPDIVHVGGGVHAPWDAGATSMSVLMGNDQVGVGFGTSYAAPLASSMAAHAWKALEGNADLPPSPALVKALMIHAAQLASPQYSSYERRYLGTGLPTDVMSCLYDTPDSFTLVFDARVVPGLQRWRKSPYPIPASLRRDGKFCGEIIITAAYAPPLNPDSGSEYVRANVELSFGVLEGDKMHSKVPLTGEEGTNGYESMQVEHGGKWAPVKVHRKQFSQGITGEDWGLQARAFMRALEPSLVESLQVYIICTLRALDGNPNVHTDGLRALANTNWVMQSLPITVPIVV